MSTGLRSRFWAEIVIGAITAVLAVVTLVWHDWIEIVVRADPDASSGLTEWLVVAVLLLLTLTLATAAGREWRRAAIAAASTAIDSRA